MNMFSLSGKTAIITGGNSGIGLGMAKGLAEAGANVVIIGRNKIKNEDSIKVLTQYEVKSISIEADVRNAAEISKALKIIKGTFKEINILINNAGTTIRSQPENLTEKDWHFVMDSNLTSAFLFSKACYPEFKKAGGGKILNNGSMLSLFGSSWGSVYGASKGGIMQMTRSHATAWAKDNIQVNCFLPGWIDTALTKEARITIPDLNEKVSSRTPAGRWGQPNDLAGAAVFLSSSASDFITGIAMPIDGGFSISL
jgi:2-deoxy-D-gluconate 3-dehydrogenase